MAQRVLDPNTTAAEEAVLTKEEPASLPYNEEEVSLWTLGTMILRKRRLAGIVGLLGVVLGTIWVAVTANDEQSWTTVATFLPDEAVSASSSFTAELASRLGLNLPRGTTGLHFYSDLILSRALLGLVAETRYRVVTDSGTVEGTIAEIAGIHDEDPEKLRSQVIDWLRDRVAVEVNSATSVVSLFVSAPYPDLARDLADRLIDVLGEYNISLRQNSASEERKFIEGRLAALRAELAEAEAALATFLKENRQFENSPELMIAFERLQRDVSMKQQVVASLVQSYEQARIVEVRNTPVITLLDLPETPLEPDRKTGPVIRMIGVLFVSLLVGVTAALVAGFLERVRAEPPAPYLEFEAELLTTRAELRQLFRGVGARIGRGGGSR